MSRNLIIGLLFLVLLAIPIVRNYLESTMVGTMLVQYPLLVISGYLLAMGLPSKWYAKLQLVSTNGIAGMLLVVFLVVFWSLPRTIDVALNEPVMELLKYISLPVLVGIPLYFSWQVISGVGKAFIWANLISMIFVMSWLYLASPARLCNNYLVIEQQQLGKSLFILGGLISLTFVKQLFFGKTVKF